MLLGEELNSLQDIRLWLEYYRLMDRHEKVQMIERAMKDNQIPAFQRKETGPHMNSKYDEIMNLPHHVSKTRPQMPMSDRATAKQPIRAQ